VSLKKLAFIPDVHCPYHDVTAVDLVIKVLTSYQPDTIVIGGDFADFYAVSSHSKDPERIAATSFTSEVRQSRELLGRFAKLAKTRIFIEGNHEDRYRRYLADVAPELSGIATVPELLHIEKLGFSFVPYKSHVKIGKLSLTHDCGNAGRTAHLNAMDTFQGSIIINHTHRMSYTVEGDANGQAHVGAMFGWLGDITKVDYMHRIKANRNWALGFGIGYHDLKTDYVYVQPIPLVNYTCVVEGKLYK
jgi:hypothetical protein